MLLLAKKKMQLCCESSSFFFGENISIALLGTLLCVFQVRSVENQREPTFMAHLEKIKNTRNFHQVKAGVSFCLSQVHAVCVCLLWYRLFVQLDTWFQKRY